MAFTKCAHHRPTHECSDADIRHKVCDQVQHKRVTAEWIPSQRLETEVRNAQVREQIRRNGEVDLLARMATRLPVPDYDPRCPEDIAMCGGPAPTPARKWILRRRRVVTFDGAHWVFGLPMRGDRRMLWVKWLWGKVLWDGTGAPWDHTTPKCPICLLHHGTTVHKRLIHCMRWEVAFRKMWLSTWGHPNTLECFDCSVPMHRRLAVLPTASESPLVYACELRVFAMCPPLRGSTVSYAGDAHFPKHSLEYSLNFWSRSKKKRGYLRGFPHFA